MGGVLPFPLILPSPSSSGPLSISTKWEVVSLCAQLLAAFFLCRNPCPYSLLRTQGFNFSTFFFFFFPNLVVLYSLQNLSSPTRD